MSFRLSEAEIDAKGRWMKARWLVPVAWIVCTAMAASEEPREEGNRPRDAATEAEAEPVAEPKAELVARKAVSPELKAELEKLQLPGLRINIEEWSVDVDARVCLDNGMLELIACTKNTKEHESILQIHAKPSQIHTALLLLGARNGSPAMQQAVDAEMTEFRQILPTGDPIGVFLVWKDESGKESERPIREFIKNVGSHGSPKSGEPQKRNVALLPTHTFLFAGSVLIPQEGGPKRYICDESGNVISLSTFGDELLCLPEIHADQNASLVWGANAEALPPVDTQVILRLRPQRPAVQPAATPDK
jgi:hypothetical protein